MSEFIPSLAIPLGEYPAGMDFTADNETFRRPNPMRFNENLMSVRGLSRHMDKIYEKEVEQHQDPTLAVDAVIDFFRKMDEYRGDVAKLIEILNRGPGEGIHLEGFEIVVGAIATVKMSPISKEKNAWPHKQKSKNRRYEALRTGLQAGLFKETAFGKRLAWHETIVAAHKHQRFLLHQLTEVADHELMDDIYRKVQPRFEPEDSFGELEETVEV